MKRPRHGCERTTTHSPEQDSSHPSSSLEITSSDQGSNSGNDNTKGSSLASQSRPESKKTKKEKRCKKIKQHETASRKPEEEGDRSEQETSSSGDDSEPEELPGPRQCRKRSKPFKEHEPEEPVRIVDENEYDRDKPGENLETQGSMDTNVEQMNTPNVSEVGSHSEAVSLTPACTEDHVLTQTLPPIEPPVQQDEHVRRAERLRNDVFLQCIEEIVSRQIKQMEERIFARLRRHHNTIIRRIEALHKDVRIINVRRQNEQ